MVVIDEPRFASALRGGHSMPQLGDWRARPSGFKMDDMSAGDKVMAVAAPIAMHAGANALGKHVINPLMDKAGAAIGDAVGGLWWVCRCGRTSHVWRRDRRAGFWLAATPTTALATNSVGTRRFFDPRSRSRWGGQDVLAAGAGAGSAAGAGLASTAAAALPWVGGAYLLGSALDLWADGGPVPLNNLAAFASTCAKAVTAPTSARKPPTRSRRGSRRGEYVVNADAVKDVGKDKLEKINEKGLKKRYGKRKGGKGGKA